MSKIQIGSPWPLGSSLTNTGVNFSVAAPYATHLELLIFESPNDEMPARVISLDKKNKSGDYWHIEVEGLNAGCYYCYRVQNQKDLESNQSYSDSFLLDPCARSISGWASYQRNNSKEISKNSSGFLKSVVSERDLFDFNTHPRPKHEWEKTIIYELHVKAFTHQNESKVSENNKGTFLGIKEKIPYLKDLGITTIELLPIFAFDPNDSPFGVSNYWGYSPVNWFTPHINFIVDQNPLKARTEFREFVAACHDEGLEVLLDVVYNHTSEGNENGPVISWRGFGDSIYYHKDKANHFLDVSGCGNTIAANHPIVRNLILESMRCWSKELGVDGFRFDLGIALSRGENLKPLDKPPLFEEIEADPYLSELKLISEPWDCGGLYRLSDFPARRIKTWNGKFRDDVRRFWKGDKSCTWDLKDRLSGSPSIYKKETSPQKSINFITSHDGFTLNDLVSFDSKHNFANGENNQDGDNHNNSWNHGIEGPCEQRKLQELRKKQQYNLLTTLLLSPGIPMLLMGDEVSRSQGGNNNTWCQNSPLGWMIWHEDNCDLDQKYFVKKLIAIRKSLPELFSPKFYINEKSKSIEENKSNLWIEWHGIKLKKPDWGSWSHTISYSINDGKKGSLAWFGLNAYSKSMFFELPKPISPWEKVLDTGSYSQKQVPEKPSKSQTNVQIESKSLVLMLAKEYSEKINF